MPVHEAGEAGDDGEKFSGLDGLRNVHLIAGGERFDAILDAGKSRQRDGRDSASRMLLVLSNSP